MAQHQAPTENDVFGNPDPGQRAFHIGCGGEVILITDNEWGCMGCGGVVDNNDIEIVDL